MTLIAVELIAVAVQLRGGVVGASQKKIKNQAYHKQVRILVP